MPLLLVLPDLGVSLSEREARTMATLSAIRLAIWRKFARACWTDDQCVEAVNAMMSAERRTDVRHG